MKRQGRVRRDMLGWFGDDGTYDAVPTRLTSTGDGLIHHVIRNEEIGLQLVPSPSSHHLTVWSAPCQEDIPR